jgi:hypothetical protein
MTGSPGGTTNVILNKGKDRLSSAWVEQDSSETGIRKYTGMSLIKRNFKALIPSHIGSLGEGNNESYKARPFLVDTAKGTLSSSSYGGSPPHLVLSTVTVHPGRVAGSSQDQGKGRLLPASVIPHVDGNIRDAGYTSESERAPSELGEPGRRLSHSITAAK